ncbi:DUF2332 domain-containing protein [Lentzea sp. NPDC006480]|uniref:DUF2332 domain-containing protein n=1 Tax=Lentzea sp. NPDC006480 TaxID=3157176 RepID=UPI0033A1D90C
MITDVNLRMLRQLASGMVGQTPMSSAMLNRLVDEIEGGGGPIVDLISGHRDVNVPLFAVRLLAGVRYLVITGQSPDLAAHLDGMLDHLEDHQWIDRTWQLFRSTIQDNSVEIASALDRPVQQHQPDRAAPLLRGLGMLAAPEVRLLELGACAGLNLIPDRYRWIAPQWEWGDGESKVRLAGYGPSPGRVSIVERAGCDLHPLNPGNPRDAAILRSFVPHELSIEQMELDDAIELAAVHGVAVDQADAVRWLEDKLRDSCSPDVYTVVWHSVFWGYLEADQQREIEDILCRAAIRTPVANICYEPHELGGMPMLQVRVYS